MEDGDASSPPNTADSVDMGGRLYAIVCIRGCRGVVGQSQEAGRAATGFQVGFTKSLVSLYSLLHA
jgi:hypothetical protein